MPRMTRQERAEYEARKIERHRAAAVESAQMFFSKIGRKPWGTLVKISHVPEGVRFTLEDAKQSEAYLKVIRYVERQGLKAFVYERWSKGDWAGKKPTYYLAYAKRDVDISTITDDE